MANNCSSGSDVKKPGLLEVSPGLFVDPTVRRECANGSGWVLLDPKGMQQLGLPWNQRRQLWRLNEAGFIRMAIYTPKMALLELQSWREHLVRVQDPWFWDKDGANLRKYRGTYA